MDRNRKVENWRIKLFESDTSRNVYKTNLKLLFLSLSLEAIDMFSLWYFATKKTHQWENLD